MLIITLSELQLKEVIMIDDGSRLGPIDDLEIDGMTGRIKAIVLLAKEKKNGIFSKADEIIIHWNQILKIGYDVILVKQQHEPELTGPSYTEKE